MRFLPFDYAARNAGRKPLKTVLTTFGAAAVVFLVILMGSFVQSLASTMRSSGEPENAIILGLGSEDFLEQSEIGLGVPTILSASVEGIEKHYGQPMLSPEIHHSTLVIPEGMDRSNIAADKHKGFIRGVTPAAFHVHQQVYLTEGSFPRAGEVLVGKLAPAKLGLPPELLALGSKIDIEGRTWTVSGRIEAPGTVYEAELWVPMHDLRVQTKRETITCVVARMDDPSVFSDIDFFCKSRLDLELAAVREVTYYGSLARFFRPMQIMGWIMAGLIVASGLFGGLNVMIAAIASRMRELACLETLGFSRTAILVSLMQESLLQVGAGTLLAVAAAAAFLSGTAIKFTMGAVALQIEGYVLAAGVAAGLTLAVLGTLIPAIRLVRTPLVELLRG